ncbi:phage antirepressor [Peptoanaerobacter stomatis]|uniref:phage antirepressor n=1 Tax=Peptoanaerobacter stomatis TaxID=796937 RepID=UPI003F9F9D14
MNNIQVFNNKEFGQIRAVQIKNNPYFVGRDIAEKLGYSRPNEAISTHCRGTLKQRIPTNSGVQEMLCIPESDIYRLIFRSKLPEAEKFTEWVTSEVLPMIRKTGMYITDNVYDAITKDPVKFGEMLIDYGKVRKENQELLSQIEQDKPKVLFADAVSASQTSILIGDLAKLLKQNGYDTGQKRLFEELRTKGFLMKSGNSYNMPTQRAMEMQLFEVKETTINNSDGSIRVTKTTKVTGKGQQYFINLFLKNIA